MADEGAPASKRVKVEGASAGSRVKLEGGATPESGRPYTSSPAAATAASPGREARAEDAAHAGGGAAGGGGASAHSSQQFWVVKVPSYVAEKWRSAIAAREEASAEDRLELGVFDIERSTLRPSDPELSVELKLTPRTVEASPGGGPMVRYLILSEHDSCRIEGQPSLVLDARVGDAAQHIRFLREHEARQAAKRRSIKSVDVAAVRPRSVVALGGAGPAAGGGGLALAPAGQARERELRVTVGHDEVVRRLMTAFQKKPLYTLGELMNETDQPREQLIKVLAEVCDQLMQGRVRFRYALKAKYHNAAYQAALAAALADPLPPPAPQPPL